MLKIAPWWPMFLASMVLHGALLHFPLPPEPDPQSEAETSREETVKITRLVSPPPDAKPQPTPQAAKPPLPKEPRQPQPPPIAALRPPSKPQPISPPPMAKTPNSPTPTPQKQLIATPRPAEKPAGSPTPSPTPTPTPEGSAEAARAGTGLMEALRPKILDRLSESTNDPAAMAEYLDSLPYLFVREEQRQYFFSQEDRLKEGAFSSLAIPQTNPTSAYYDYIEPVLQGELGFAIESLDGPYGEADLYRAKNEAGVEFYLSLVKLKGSGAFFVLWKKDPRTPPDLSESKNVREKDGKLTLLQSPTGRDRRRPPAGKIAAEPPVRS